MTLSEFGEWALKQGSVANPEPNNKFKGQCVSLIQQYLYRVFGKQFKAYGNAKDWEYNYPRGYFTKLSANTKLQKGDVLVYGSNYGGGYGHMGLIDINGKFFDQNGTKKLAVGYRNEPFINYVCILRPIEQNKLELNKKERYEIGETYTTQVDLKVRDGAGTSARHKNRNELTADGKKHALAGEKAVLKAKTRVTCQEIKTIGSNIWIKIPSGWIAGYYNNKDYVK